MRNHIGGVLVSVLSSSAVHRGLEPWLGQTKDYKIGSCCFSAKHTALRRKSKDWLARNQNNVSEWSDMTIHRLLFQWASTLKNPAQHVGLNKADLIIISLKINLFSPWYSWKIAELALTNNHSLTDIQKLCDQIAVAICKSQNGKNQTCKVLRNCHLKFRRNWNYNFFDATRCCTLRRAKNTPTRSFVSRTINRK